VTATTAPPRPRRRIGRSALALIVIAMLAMWGYVLYLAFGPGRADPPDRLDDPAFAAAAQVRCSQALDEVAALPPAFEAGSAAERAGVVDTANASFAAMLDDLDALVPDGEDGGLVTAWLADWRTYLGDRERYAEALRDDPGARVLVSPKDGQHITEYLDAFAADNDMPACGSPLDV